MHENIDQKEDEKKDDNSKNIDQDNKKENKNTVQDKERNPKSESIEHGNFSNCSTTGPPPGLEYVEVS